MQAGGRGKPGRVLGTGGSAEETMSAGGAWGEGPGEGARDMMADGSPVSHLRP